MNNEHIYVTPAIEVVGIIVETAILAASTERSNPEFGE